MYTKQQLVEKRSMKAIAKDVDQLVRKPLIKVDTGNRVSIRDKAIRKIMPKAMDCLGRKINKDSLLTRIMGMIEKAQGMGKDKADNLVAQLWVIYAHIEVNHVSDDHWQISDIPQPHNMPKLTDKWYVDKDGKLHAKPDQRENVHRGATKHWTGDEGQDTNGNHFYKVKSEVPVDNPDGCWSYKAYLATNREWV